MTTTIKAVLVGYENSVNMTIMDMLEDQTHIHSQFWPQAIYQQKLSDWTDRIIDVMIVDLTSFTDKPATVVKSLSAYPFISSILAMHFYSTRNVVESLLKAGALGYLRLNTHEGELLEAIQSLEKGERYLGRLS